MNPEVDRFIKKSKQWQLVITKLRSVLLTTKLEENYKWNLPCYIYEGNNITIIQPFKACLGLMFFKGALLKDKKKILVNNGPNSQSSRRLEFTSVEEVTKLTSIIKVYVKEAIANEESGLKVEFKKTPEPLPEELKKVFAKKPKLKKAFELLTPGRQRGYVLHFSGAK